MSDGTTSAKNTGGGGFVFEAKVAAHYMTLMLSAQSPFAPKLDLITKIDFQTKPDWLFDDLLLTLTDQNGASHRIALSVKSNIQFSGGKAPQDFVHEAWEQYTHDINQVFDASSDHLGLVTTPLPTQLRNNLDSLLAMAQHRPASGLRADKLSQPKKKLFESFACPDDLASRHRIKPGEQGQLISLLEFPGFDFESPSSRDESAVIAVCLSLLAKPDQTEAAKLWDRLWHLADEYRISGGSIELRTLVARLQGFQLQEYPLYRRDWKILIENAKDTLKGVPNAIGGIHVSRAEFVTELESLVSANKHVTVLGSSGCGKSAVVKELVEGQLAGETVLWWHASVFDDVSDYAAFERDLGLQHRLRDLLQNTSSSTPLLVIDGIDRIYQDKAYRTLSALIRNLGYQSQDSPWRVILTCQSEEWDRVRKRLAEVNLDNFAWQSFFVRDFQPDKEDLSPVWEQYPALRSLFLQDRLRPVLCKPIVLNALAMNAAELQEDIAKTWLGESDVIDWFWDNVVRRREPEAIRSEMLMVLGEKQADRLEHDVPERELPNLEHLSELKKDGLCVSRPNDRVTFCHDIYGDWARLRRLMQLEQKAVPFIKQRLKSPMWHRVIRLYGLRLVEQNTDLAMWQLAFEALGSENDVDNIAQLLLLDSAILAANAPLILERLSSVLLANQGKLLRTLLQRFLHVATLPDPRMQAMADQEGWDTHETAAHFRIPNWPLWPAMIRFLHNHKEQVIAVVAGNVSEIADKWLRETPVGFPLRKEAAELGVLVAERLLHGEMAVGTQIGDYKSGLAAAHEFPERVASFVLEAAGRTAFAPRSARVRHQLDAIVEPWPDGPRTEVDTDFQEQCLSPSNAGAMNPLIDANPSIAREVILALLISLPHERHIYDYSRILLDRLEIENVHGYFPPIYFRGPFLYFLRAQPDEGLDLIIRLVDFMTDRWADRFLQQASTPSLVIDLPEKNDEWIGDYYVHQWYQLQGHAPEPVVCALMSLEKWLYDKMDANESLDEVIHTIHSGSHSMALIGVLCALGRKKPELFTGPLLPYLAVPELHDWEMTSTVQSCWSWAGIGWSAEHAEWLRKLAYEWHNAPHRKHGMDQWAIRLFLTDDHVQTFLQSAAEEWKQRLQGLADGDTDGRLEPLIPKFEIENYREIADEGGNTYLVYHQPAALQEKYAPRLKEINEQGQLRDFVMKCRQILDGQLSLDEVGLEQFWQEFQAVSLIPDQEQPEPLFFSNRNARCAGAAVIIELHSKWVGQDLKRLMWCREQLIESVVNPPGYLDGDLEDFAGDDWVWDSFCARAIPTIWQQQPNSSELRECVGVLATGHHRNSISSLLWSASRYREVLGDNFRQLQHLLLRYASVYLLLDRNNLHYNPDFDWTRWRLQQVDAFVNGDISPHIPPWTDIIQQEYVPSGRFQLKPALDTLFVNAAYSWLPELSEAVDEKERSEWIDFWKQSLSYSLENHTSADFPYPADRWVLSRIPGVIVNMQSSENPQSLWEPILSLAADKKHWVETFLDDWFAYGLRCPSSADNFRQRWIDMIEYCFESELWDADRSRKWHVTLDLWTRLMGLWVSTEGSELWNETKADFVLAMLDYLERWCSMFLKYGHCAQRYAAFLAQPAAASIRVRSLVWLESGAKAGGDYWWKEREVADSLARVLTVVWNSQQSELKQHQLAFAAFMSFFSRLTAQLNPIALELESRM